MKETSFLLGKILPPKSFRSRDLEEIRELMGPENWSGEVNGKKKLEEIIETPQGQKWLFPTK
jgi:hypothetical protein